MKNQKIYVAGHFGMVGCVIVRQLLAQDVLEKFIAYQTYDELNLTNQSAV
jgi:hypothetical protein